MVFGSPPRAPWGRFRQIIVTGVARDVVHLTKPEVVLGREDGYCKGRSGSLHISAREIGVVLTSTIVGGELSMAPGVALAQKMGKGEAGGIAAVFFGDGASNQGSFHEALNLAAAWNLPLLFVCEEAHRRGLQLHAWFNPFRAKPAGAKYELADSHVGRTHPVRG